MRIQALKSLATCISISGDPTVNEEVLISLYRKLYGSVDNEKFTRMNDFSDFPLYFIQQEFMRAIGLGLMNLLLNTVLNAYDISVLTLTIFNILKRIF